LTVAKLLIGVLAFATVSVAIAAADRPAAAAGPPHPQLRVGGFPTGIALNAATHTVYVANGTTHSLSLIDASTCRAGRTRGCGQRVTAVTAGFDPIGVAVDEATNTIYVVNYSGTVAVVDGRTCRAARTSGCRVRPTTVAVGFRPQFLALDTATRTLYVTNEGSNTISVIDARTCNARRKAGCRRPLASIPVGPAPFALAVNPRTSSIYVTTLGAPTVAIVDGRTCNAATTNGCRRRPATVNVGETPGGIAVNTRTNTVYVTGESSHDVSILDGRTCNARTTSGCRPVRVRAGAGARGIAVNEATNTVYVANTVANTVTVIDGATCSARVRSGCRKRRAVTRVGTSPRRIAVDERANTIYVTNAWSNTVTMIDGRTCNGRVRRGCS
jgi:YVTN family beta-propeller protein